jgi:hypothetical protein
MLVGQGVLGISYWTGIDADAGVMRSALEKVFACGPGNEPVDRDAWAGASVS